MDKSILIQKQVRDNAQDLHSFMSDMKNWETEMKRKESELTGGSIEQDFPPIRSIHKKTKSVNNKQKPKEKRINSSDYASWDKFDVDKACEMVDSGNVGPSSLDSKESEKQKEEKLREEANLEKEKGNQFVKLQKWDEAISCYTRAINIFHLDAIYYANRGLCYLKKENMHAAESDCNRAIDLDPGYVKALQRRSSARMALGSLRRASADLQRILEIEPNNKPVQQQLAALTLRMGTKGTNYKSSPATTPSDDDSSRSFSELFESNDIPLNDSPEPPISHKKVTEIVSPKASSKPIDSKVSSLPSAQGAATTNVPREVLKASTPGADVILQSTSSTSGAQQGPSSAAKTELENDLANQIMMSLSGSQKAKSREEIVTPIDKPPHLRSKKPLFRVSISEIPRGYIVQAFPMKPAADGLTKLVGKNINKKGKFRGKRNDRRNQTGDKKPNEPSRPAKLDLTEPQPEATGSGQCPKDKSDKPDNLATEGLNIDTEQDCGNAAPCVNLASNICQKEDSMESVDLNKLELNDLPKCVYQVPKSSVQFTSQWRLLRGRDRERSAYLKSVPPTLLPDIFQNFLESDTLSEILSTIVSGEDFTRPGGECSMPYLQNLSKVKRFGALAMFLSNEDKQGILKVLDRCKEIEGSSQESINDIKNKYEL